MRKNKNLTNYFVRFFNLFFFHSSYGMEVKCHPPHFSHSYARTGFLCSCSLLRILLISNLASFSEGKHILSQDFSGAGIVPMGFFLCLIFSKLFFIYSISSLSGYLPSV